MDRLFLFTIVGCVILLGGCNQGIAATQCIEELDAMPVAVSVTVDMEHLVEGAVDKLGREPLWSDIQTIATSCEAPAALPDQMKHIAQHPSRHAPKPVQLVKVPGLSGAVFAYFSQGEEETVTGIAAALVTYGPDGKPEQVYKLAEVLRGEGLGRHTLGTLTGQSLQHCSQELEYFVYASNGDVIGELDVPTRTLSQCEENPILLPD